MVRIKTERMGLKPGRYVVAAFEKNGVLYLRIVRLEEGGLKAEEEPLGALLVDKGVVEAETYTNGGETDGEEGVLV